MNLKTCVRSSVLFAAIFSASAASAECEFSLSAAIGSGSAASGAAFVDRVGWQDGGWGYAAGCAIANLLYDEPICGEFHRDENGQPCLDPSEFSDPEEEAELLQLAADLAWAYQNGANIYDPSTWNYEAPVAPPWVWMTDQDWDNFRQGRGDCRFSPSCGIAVTVQEPDFP